MPSGTMVRTGMDLNTYFFLNMHCMYDMMNVKGMNMSQSKQ